MKTPITITSLTLATLLLSACSFVPPKDVNSTFYSPPVGSILTLKRKITIPANDARVRIQNGEIQPSYFALDSYYPNCEFELYSVSEKSREVMPDKFTITKVVRNEEIVSLVSPTQVAASGFTASIGFGDSSPIFDYQTVMNLRSANQPDVFKLTCMQWEDPNDGDHVTITQIRKTLGNIFELTLAED